MDCIQMSLLWLVGWLPVYFPIAVLYQAGKLALNELGSLNVYIAANAVHTVFMMETEIGYSLP